MRDSFSKFQEALEEIRDEQQAASLADQIGALALATNALPSAVAEGLGFDEGNMRTVLEGLGINPEDFAFNLDTSEIFDEVLGNLTSFTAVLKDWATVDDPFKLAGAISDLADNLGVSPSAFAAALGFGDADMRTVLEGLGFDPGDLTLDVGTIFDGIIGNISELVTVLDSWTTSEDPLGLALAIGNLSSATNLLPSQLATALGNTYDDMAGLLDDIGFDFTGIEVDVGTQFDDAVTALQNLHSVQAAWNLATELSNMAGGIGTLPADFATKLGFTTESMAALLQGLGIDISGLDQTEIGQKFNAIIGGLGVQGKLYQMDQRIERNLWQLGAALVQILETLGNQFIQPEIDEDGNPVFKEFYGQDSPIVRHLRHLSEMIGWAARVLEVNLQYVGNAIVQGLENYELPTDIGGAGERPRLPEYATGGWVPKTEPALVHSGEFVVPRNGALVSSDPQSQTKNGELGRRWHSAERQHAYESHYRSCAD